MMTVTDENKQSPYIRGKLVGTLQFPSKLTTEAVCKTKVSRAVRETLGGYTHGYLGLWRQVKTADTDPCYIFEIGVHCDKMRSFIIEAWLRPQIVQSMITQQTKYELLQAVIYEWKGNRKQ
jgi:hypothetical protein